MFLSSMTNVVSLQTEHWFLKSAYSLDLNLPVSLRFDKRIVKTTVKKGFEVFVII